MNNPTNHSYLAGYLESTLKNLAHDEKFLSFKKHDYNGRYEYILGLIKEANDAMVKFETNYKPIV